MSILFLMFLSMMNQFFLINLMMSVSIGLSSNSWLVCWMMLEFNLMMFVPLLTLTSTNSGLSSPIKYFLVQAMGSIILLMGMMIIMSTSFTSSLTQMSSVVLMAMVVKSGIPPFHFWFPQLLESCSALQSILLLTVQKIIPLSFISYCMSDLFYTLIILSGITGAMGGWNQNSMMKILAYSSMVHSSWILASMTLSKNAYLFYFLSYSTITLSLIIMMSKFSIKKISDSFNIISSPTNKFLYGFNFMSLGGMPPLLGFFNKLVVVKWLSSMNMMLLLLFLMGCSLLSLIYYMRVTLMVLSGYNFFLKEKNYMSFTGSIYFLYATIFVNLGVSVLVMLV